MAWLEAEDGRDGARMFLAWSGRSARFALDAACIVRVVEQGEWNGGEPYDLTAALDLDDRVTPVRVLELRSSSSPLGLLAFGAMRLCTVAHDDLLEVPDFLRVHEAGRLLRQLAVIDGVPALWVLDADAINRDAAARRAVRGATLLECADRREGDR